jgi:hypothetical protein
MLHSDLEINPAICGSLLGNDQVRRGNRGLGYNGYTEELTADLSVANRRRKPIYRQYSPQGSKGTYAS